MRYWFVVFLLGLNFALQAQPKIIIHAAVLQNQNYVVGAANAPTGLFRYEGDTLWTHLGWRNARTFGIAVNPANPDYIFLACGNGALRSLDGGASWRITTDWRMTEVLDVVMDPFDSNQVFIATAYGIWRSLDRGNSWIAANQGLKSNFVQTIEPDRRRAKRWLAGTEDGLFQTIDSGTSWQKIGPEQIAVRDIHCCAEKPGYWIVGIEDKGVLVSSDDGNTWRAGIGDIAKQTIYAVAIDPSYPNRMAAGGYQSGVWVSRDGGRSWAASKQKLPALDIHALAFDPGISGRLWVGTLGAGIYYSDDLGLNWTYAGLNGTDIWDIHIIKGAR
ncbi:MAG: hypothetical protein ONB16_00825 [candidate division KSB1 bacterium]|nr:hypothetical protein [candidate division KSB1 bacterium]MDZ7317657.1 hypothetical protein [candidate division KSB1 bacterium]MDZ7341900.1 hypothetical protein [candidate division KSB1 bacterium]